MQRKVSGLLLVLAAASILLFGSTVALAAGGDGAVPRERHPWGRFAIGSWKRVRVLSETLDGNGIVTGTSTTETTTTLVDVDDDGYTLHIEVTVEVAGRRFTAQPQIVKRGFSGESDGQTVVFKKIGDGTVTIDGLKIPSEIRQTVINGGTTKRVVTVHYSQKFAPFVLKRSTTCTDIEKKVTNYQTEVEVVAVRMPWKVLTEMKTTSTIKTVHRQSNGMAITLEVHSVDVPGGVVAHTAKEIDASDHVVRRSTLELIDYGVGDGQEGRATRRRLTPRSQRRQKTPPR